jgi:hypothetical protein
MDATAFFSSSAIDPSAFSSVAAIAAVMPPAPSLVKPLAAWNIRERVALKWCNDIPSPTMGDAGAAMGLVGPGAVDMNVINEVTRFIGALPPAPYPFDVHRSAALRGEQLYQQYCASCHQPGSTAIFPPSQTGTDPNRSKWLTPTMRSILIAQLRVACSDPVTCRSPAGAPWSDDQMLVGNPGYPPLTLEAIWARAPYLHNGSVPTLRALLTGDRPATFYRGNITYDEANVGFTWDAATSAAAQIYDTSKSGNHNTGHDTSDYNGTINWSQQPEQLADLLEYLKTL